jgi:hypothetical protein
MAFCAVLNAQRLNIMAWFVLIAAQAFFSCVLLAHDRMPENMRCCLSSTTTETISTKNANSMLGFTFLWA